MFGRQGSFHHPAGRLSAMLLAVACFAMISINAVPAFGQRPGGGAMRERMANRGGGDAAKKESKDKIKPYDEVITEKAKTDAGLFLVHQLDGKIFYEIPTQKLEKDMLWVTQIAETQAGFGYGGTGVGNRVVRWELRDESVLLRDIKYKIRADVKDDPIKESVRATSLAPIIKKFEVKAWGKDKAPVIDVTDLFLADVKEFSPASRLQASGMDKSRSFVEGVKSFPTNIETKVLATYNLRSQTGGTTPGRMPRRGGARRDPTQSAVTALVHHSMVGLPDDPMKPRRYDDRVGFFNLSFEDYAAEDHQVDQVKYITRWRLEKKDASAEVSEPKKPIVFHVGRGVPQKWRKYVKEGIEYWQPAFEAAGFKNAIIGKYAPTPREDPDWDAEDARYSTIRWLPSTIENAMGPHVHDPRTGEILEADILIYHNVTKLARDWYFVQASPMDERAQKLPMPDDLVGELLAYVVAHEVGHSLGFPHNMMASSAFSVEQLRDAEFTAKNGNEASIMDYGRFNYVAQPGDGARLIPTVGPYDFFATKWGYGQFKGPKAEKKGLAKLVAMQKDDPMLRFGDASPSEDPARQTEDLGSDTVLATEMGLKNISRVATYLVDATCKEGENYDDLRNMYDRLVGQRNRELNHVVGVVGGVHRTNLWYGDADAIYHPVVAEKQRKAVAFLNRHCFQTPKDLVTTEITRRLEPNGAADRILSGQRSVLRGLMNDGRIKRMSELAMTEAGDVYTPSDLLGDLRDGIFEELTSNEIDIDLYRRNLQRAFIGMLGDRIDSKDAGSDVPALVRSELKVLHSIVDDARRRGTDSGSIAAKHLEDLNVRIDRALDPRLRPQENGATPALTSTGFPFPRVRGCFEQCSDHR